MKVLPSGDSLGATLEGLDLARPLAREELDAVLQALGRYGVVRFPNQRLTGGQLRDFSAQLGALEINVGSAGYQEPGVPEVMILSNIVENGRPVGLADAGQGWHTDMSYSRMVAFANVLYGIKIPRRNGATLGATQFSNMQAAYADLPADVKRALEGKTVLHDFEKFWEMMRREKGSKRPPLTDAQRKAKPPVSHPVFLTHPLTGERVLYANPGYAVRINELPPKESDEMLDFLFRHQLQPKYIYTYRWTENDVLVWEDIGTIKAFYDANLSLAGENPPFDFHSPSAPIYSRPRFLPPTRVRDAIVKHSLVADGCQIGRGCTIENSVIGLRSPQGGTVRVFGQDIQHASRRRWSAIERRWGVLFQRGALFSNLTVQENVAAPADPVVSKTGKPNPEGHKIAQRHQPKMTPYSAVMHHADPHFQCDRRTKDSGAGQSAP